MVKVCIGTVVANLAMIKAELPVGKMLKKYNTVSEKPNKTPASSDDFIGLSLSLIIKKTITSFASSSIIWG